MSVPVRDTVLFLGAGFSADAGFPTMAGFLAGSKKDLTGLRQHLDTKPGKHRKAAAQLVAAGEEFHELARICESKAAIPPEDAGNLESLFTLVEALAEANAGNIRLAGKSRSIFDILIDMKLWTWKVFQQFPPLNQERVEAGDVKPQTYEDFFRILQERRSASKTVVITTNYDLVIEHYSHFLGLGPCSYPLSAYQEVPIGAQTKPFVECGLPDTTENLILCKLHGSVNYFEQREYVPESLAVARYLGGTTAIGESGAFTDRPAVYAVDAIWEILQWDGNRVPGIVPPTYAKLRDKDWLQQTWNCAFKALQTARKIIFIGYSFPVSDGFIRGLVGGAMLGRESAPEVYVINPNKWVRRRYKKFFGPMLKGSWARLLRDALNRELLEVM